MISRSNEVVTAVPNQSDLEPSSFPSCGKEAVETYLTD